MKTIALVLTLGLHVTGLWHHVPADARERLTTIATGHVARPAVAPTTTTTTAFTLAPHHLPALPLRTTSNTPKFATTSAFALDTGSGTVLFAQNATTRRPIASITKLVTVMVVLARHSPSELVTVRGLPSYGPDDERIGLAEGEVYSVGDLVRATLINSGNDAADALAVYHSGSLTKFVGAMNAKMAEWGIADTRFAGATGLQDTGNYATAEALAKIARLAITNSFAREAMNQTDYAITSTTGRIITLEATNKLLAGGQFYGIKTGYTLAAGECFVGLTRIQGHDVITVVLGASSRFGVSEDLANWINRNYQWL